MEKLQTFIADVGSKRKLLRSRSIGCAAVSQCGYNLVAPVELKQRYGNATNVAGDGVGGVLATNSVSGVTMWLAMAALEVVMCYLQFATKFPERQDLKFWLQETRTD